MHNISEAGESGNSEVEEKKQEKQPSSLGAMMANALLGNKKKNSVVPNQIVEENANSVT